MTAIRLAHGAPARVCRTIACALVVGVLLGRDLLAAAARDGQVSVEVVRSGGGPVEQGAAFELVVTRRWPAGFEADALDPRDLAPLHLVELERDVAFARAGDGGRVAVETRRFRAHAFEPGALDVGPLVCVARDPATGARLRGTSAALALDVLAVVPAEDDGALELPLTALGPRLASPVSPLWWLVVALVGASAAFALHRRRRAAAAVPARVDAEPRAADLPALRARLDALERSAAGERDARGDAGWHTELWHVLRSFLGLRLQRSLASATVTESAERALRRGVELGTVDGLAAVGRDCDAVRFAGRTSDAAARARRVAQARALAASLAPTNVFAATRQEQP